VEVEPTAEMSATARVVQVPVLTLCQVGRLWNAEQPEPEPSQAVSVQPRLVLGSRTRLVAPTAVTVGAAAGYRGRVPVEPSSPEPKLMTVPNGRKWTLSATSPADSGRPQLFEM
jgi:hypothetical protein